MPEGINRCCGGFAGHFDHCELGQLEQSMRRRGVVQYDAHLDRLDADDRAWVAAQDRGVR
jgi:hypothetical protein